MPGRQRDLHCAGVSGGSSQQASASAQQNITDAELLPSVTHKFRIILRTLHCIGVGPNISTGTKYFI